MDFAQMNLIAALPEIFLLCLLGVVLIVDLFLDDSRRYMTHALTQLGLLVAVGLQIHAYGMPNEEAFGGMFINDGIAQFAKTVMYVAVFLLLAYSRRYLQDNKLYKGEYYTLTLFALLGMWSVLLPKAECAGVWMRVVFVRFQCRVKFVDR